eukprot:4700555-Amphidinium_carterae.1
MDSNFKDKQSDLLEQNPIIQKDIAIDHGLDGMFWRWVGIPAARHDEEVAIWFLQHWKGRIVIPLGHCTYRERPSRERSKQAYLSCLVLN